MSEDKSMKNLALSSEDMQKLFEVTSRIDERLKSVQSKQEHLDKKIDDINQAYVSVLQKIAILEIVSGNQNEIFSEIDTTNKHILELDKRLSKIENDQGKHDERWKNIATFVIQLVWVILAAYLLTKFELQAPAVP